MVSPSSGYQKSIEQIQKYAELTTKEIAENKKAASSTDLPNLKKANAEIQGICKEILTTLSSSSGSKPTTLSPEVSQKLQALNNRLAEGDAKFQALVEKFVGSSKGLSVIEMPQPLFEKTAEEIKNNLDACFGTSSGIVDEVNEPLDPRAEFKFYDQNHRIGSDILQNPKNRNLL